MNTYSLEFRNVTFGYEGAKEDTLDSVDMKVKKGEFISIIGPSGCGKSTLFRLITGLENPSKGEIFINGTRHANRSGLTGYMPQQDMLMPWRTVLENASLPLEFRGMKKTEAHSKVMKQLELFGLKGKEHLYPYRLSGGMKQRVSFLRAVLSGSELLLLDEPFSALDAITRIVMQDWLLDQWRVHQHSILFITHDVGEALYLSDRIFVCSGSPLNSLEEVIVPLGRPRSLEDLYNPAISDLRMELIERLRAKVVV